MFQKRGIVALLVVVVLVGLMFWLPGCSTTEIVGKKVIVQTEIKNFAGKQDIQSPVENESSDAVEQDAKGSSKTDVPVDGQLKVPLTGGAGGDVAKGILQEGDEATSKMIEEKVDQIIADKLKEKAEEVTGKEGDDQGEDDQGEEVDVSTLDGSTAYSHKNLKSWDGKGTSVVMCLDTPEFDSCEINGKSMELHGKDYGRYVWTFYRQPGVDGDMICEKDGKLYRFVFSGSGSMLPGDCWGQKGSEA